MKKVLVLLLVCFMALGASLAMADTRTDALGLTAGQQVDDLDSIWLFPQDAASFGNVVDLRLNNPSNEWGDGGTYGDWGGVIHKDFDEIGYFGVYFNRPFNQSNGIAPQSAWANQNGILNGFTSWDRMVSPYYGSYGNTTVGDIFNHVNAYFDHNSLRLRLVGIRSMDPQNKADIFWAKDFSDVTIGAHVNYAAQDGNNGGYFGNNWGSTNGTRVPVAPTNGQNISQTTNFYTGVLGLDLGVGFKNVGAFEALNVAAGYSLGSMDYSGVNNRENPALSGTNVIYSDKIKDNNISEIRANVLGKLKINDTSTGRIYLNGRFDNLGMTQAWRHDSTNAGSYSVNQGDTANLANGYSDSNINLGFACDHSVADGKAKVIVGLEAIYDSRAWTESGTFNLAGNAVADQLINGSGSTYNEDWWVVPFNIAIEAPINDWLTARMGAHGNLFQQITDKVVQKTNLNAGGTAYQDTVTASNSFDYPSANNIILTYGLSAKFNNLTIDMQLDPAAMLDTAQNFEPGSGILYANNDMSNAANSNIGTLGQMFQCVIQADMRYAF